MPLGDFEVSAALLEAAFGWAAAGLTGISASALGAVGGVAAVGGYSLWAAENPEDAAEFEQYLAENVVSQDVGGNQQLAMNLQAMPSTLKDSIIDYVSGVQRVAMSQPVFPEGLSTRYELFAANGSVVQGYPLNFSSAQLDFISSHSSEFVAALMYKDRGKWVVNSGNLLAFSGDYEVQLYSTNHGSAIRLVAGPNGFTSVDANGTVTSYAEGGHKDVDPSYLGLIRNVNLGLGSRAIPLYGDVSSGLSTAFDSLVAGTGTAADVAIAGGVEAVYLPNVAINESTVTVDDAYDVSGVTYPDIAITIDGGGGTVPVPTDVLTALQQIIGLLTPMGTVSGIPPIVQDIDDKMGTIVDEWPGVMDNLDGLGLLPPIMQDIADGMGVIIDIPQSLEDITDILLPIPQSLQGLLDGVTIDIPQTLAQILNGTLSIPTAIDGVISGVAALPATIAGALDIDWVLENTEELKDRLPDLDAPLILPQASFDDLKDVANDYKERTPLGKIFEAYEGTFDVMSTSPQGAPRYEITFPSPINYTFVIDFSVFDGLFVQLAHAFFYLLAIFWYLKFLKSVKGWVDSWLTFDGKFFHVAGEEAGASWE